MVELRTNLGQVCLRSESIKLFDLKNVSYDKKEDTFQYELKIYYEICPGKIIEITAIILRGSENKDLFDYSKMMMSEGMSIEVFSIKIGGEKQW